MCSWRDVAALALAVLLSTQAQGASFTPTYGLGKPATPEEIGGWDIDVRPDGMGLPRGRGTVAQGQALYDAKCASCHGTFGESNDYLLIAGGVGTLGSEQPMRSTGSKLNHATTLWDYIRRAMPWTQPKSLTPDEVYAVTAYMLHLAGVLPDQAVLSDRNIADVQQRLPNRNGLSTEHGLWPGRAIGNGGRPDVRLAEPAEDDPRSRGRGDLLRPRPGSVQSQGQPVA